MTASKEYYLLCTCVTQSTYISTTHRRLLLLLLLLRLLLALLLATRAQRLSSACPTCTVMQSFETEYSERFSECISTSADTRGLASPSLTAGSAALKHTHINVSVSVHTVSFVP
jgi:hypothetical protein